MKIKNKKEYFERIKKIKGFFWWLGDNTFWGTIIFIILSIIAGFLVFYKYELRIKQKEIVSMRPILKFQELNYQNVLIKWSNRDNNLEQIKKIEYLNPFDESLMEISLPKEETEKIIEEIENLSPLPKNPFIYTIKPGDNLWILAERFLGSGFKWVEITDIDGNPYPDWRADVLRIGEKIIIPTN